MDWAKDAAIAVFSSSQQHAAACIKTSRRHPWIVVLPLLVLGLLIGLGLWPTLNEASDQVQAQKNQAVSSCQTFTRVVCASLPSCAACHHHAALVSCHAMASSWAMRTPIQ